MNTIKLGIFVTIGLLLFIATLYYLGSRKNLFSNNVKITASFTNADGIQAGSNVRLAGVKVGAVEEVTINSDSSVTIAMVIDKSASAFIKKDAKASIGSDGLMGNKLINISDGSANVASVEDHDTLAVKEQTGINNIMKSVMENSTNLETITRNLVTITERVMDGEGAVGKLLFDKEAGQKIERMIDLMEETGANSAHLTNQLQLVANRVAAGKGMAGKLFIDDGTAEQFDVMMDSISRVTEEAGVIAGKLSEFSARLNNQAGTISQLLTDTTMAKNLEMTIVNARKRTQEMEETIAIINNSWILNLFGNKKRREN